MDWADFVVIAAYFIIILIVGLWASHRSKRASMSGYFLASRNMHWTLVGASLFASNVGSGHFIGLAGSGAAGGIAIATFELHAIFVLILLGWFFVPVYMTSGAYTMPEYLRKRFGGQRIRVYLAVLSLLLYIFTKISADLYAGALFIKLAMGLKGEEGMYISIVILLGVAALFTIAGGLTAVIWTDFVQTILMITGAFILTFIAFDRVGGYEELIRKYFEAIPNKTAYDVARQQPCGAPRADALHFMRDLTADLPWTGITFGLTISAVWCWCSDQVIVQRTLAAKNMLHAKGGCILGSYFKILPLYFLVFTGMASRVLFPDRVACADPAECTAICGSTSGCSNIAYVELVINVMPRGLSGLMLAVMMAALMSSLTSIFNSSSTIFTIDIWTRFRRNASDMELLLVGRLSVLVLVIISIIWVPIIVSEQDSQLFVYIQKITSYLAPPVCAVYVLAVTWERINEKGAFWGLLVGLIIGILRFGLEFGYVVPPCGSNQPDPRPEFIQRVIGGVHYLHFGCILFVICVVISGVISLLTEPIPKENLYRLTFWTRYSTKPRRDLDEPEDPSLQKMDMKSLKDPGSGQGEGLKDMKSLKDPGSGQSEGLKDMKSLKDPGSGQGEGLNEQRADCVEPTLGHRVFKFLCGIDVNLHAQTQRKPRLTMEQDARQAAMFLHEEPFWRRFTNINAVLVMTIATFVWAFYA